MEKRPALGKGLNALIPDAPEALRTPPSSLEVDIDLVEPNEYQPRLHIDESRLDELANSIRENGVIQPIVVRRVGPSRFQIIAGERRWRAAQRAGLLKVPVVVKEVPPDALHRVLEWALIENVQREDLNPIDEAGAYQRLLSEFNLTQDQVAERVGKSRASVANMLRLLRLPGEVIEWMREGRLSVGHAKALLALSDPQAIVDSAREMIRGKFSVRQAEALVARPGKGGSKAQGVASPDPNVRAAIDALERALGTKVTIQGSAKKGRIEIHFHSSAELDRLYQGLSEARF
jgi:ParB family chromosome partitioning protein